MKKKWLLMVLALAMSASMAACDFGSTSSESNSEAPVESSSPAESSTPDSETNSDVGGEEGGNQGGEDVGGDEGGDEGGNQGGNEGGEDVGGDEGGDQGGEDVGGDEGGDEGGDGPIVETYLIKFVDAEGNVVSEAWVEEGEMPEAPQNMSVPENTEFITYSGAWDKTIVAADTAATYTWVITETRATFVVTFDGENEIEVAYEGLIDPPSAATKKPGFVATGWMIDGEIVDLSTYKVSGNVNLTAVWEYTPYATSGEDIYMNAYEWEGAPGEWYYEVGSQADVLEWAVNLPLMAYEEGKTVTYNWRGGAWILVGLNGAYVQGQGVGSEGTISITNVGGVLVVTIENTANPATISGSINNQDVIAGNAPLTLSVNNGAQFHHFFLSKTATVTDSTLKVDTFVVDYLGNKEIATEENGVITYRVAEKHGDADNGKFGDILLPKMDFTQNKCVTLDWTLSGWTMFGIDTNLWFTAQGEAVSGTATLSYSEADGTLTAWVESNGVGHSHQWTDRDIIEGRKSVDFGFYAWSNQMIFISNIAVVESVAVTFDGGYAQEVAVGSKVTPPDIPAPVGKVFNCWTLNGEKVDFTTFVATENVDFVGVWDEVPYAESAAGAALNASYGAATEGYWWFRVGEFDAAVWTVNLPKQAYTDGKMTTFNWIFGDWCKIGFAEGNWLDLPGNQSAEGTLTVTNNGGTLTLVLTNTITSESLTTTITDADVVAGNKALTLTINAGAPYRHFNITNGVEGEIPVIPEEPEVTQNTNAVAADGTVVKATASDVFEGGLYYAIGGAEQYWTISLAELNYSAYETVTYEFQGMSDWMKICLGSTGNGIRNQSASIKGTIVFTKQADGTFLVVINETTTGSSVSDTLTDAEVINGNTSYTFFVKAVNSASNFHLGAPTMTEATTPEGPETPVVVTYAITFVDSDGNVLSEQTVEEGKMPEIPTNVTTPENTDTMTYTGAWDKEIVAATGDVTYTWVVTATEVKPANIFDTTVGYNSAGTAFAPSNTSDTGATYTLGADYGKGLISLPKIDYTKYTTVTMNFATSGWIQFGWNDQLFYYDAATAITGTITLTYRDGLVYMVFEGNGVVNPQGWDLTFSSTDVHTGKEAIMLGYNNISTWMAQTITISNFTMTEATIPEEPEVPAAPYTFEGAATWVGETKVADAVIGEDSVSFNTVMNATFSTLQLAKVDFTKYPKVTFNWTSSDWILVGYGSDLWFAYTGAGEKNGTVTMSYADGKITLTMANVSSTYSVVITDADIINGKKAFALNAQGYADYQGVHVTNFAVHEPAPYSFEGAATWAGETKQSDASIGEDSVSFSNVMNATFSTLQLAKVDFTKYSQVTFNWTSSAWLMVGYGSDLWFSYTGAGETNGTVTMIYADGQITLTMANASSTHSVVITDADIINGKKAFALNAQGHADYQGVQVTNFTVTK